MTIVECTSAHEQLYRLGKLDEVGFRSALAWFAADIGNRFVIVGFQSGWVELAKDLVLQHSLRTLDSLQLAAALGLKPLALVFACADEKLLEVAEAVGLKVLNPTQ